MTGSYSRQQVTAVDWLLDDFGSRWFHLVVTVSSTSQSVRPWRWWKNSEKQNQPSRTLVEAAAVGCSLRIGYFAWPRSEKEVALWSGSSCRDQGIFGIFPERKGARR